MENSDSKTNSSSDIIPDIIPDLNYMVYLLKNTHNNKTYLGITNNHIRRLRQHNCEIKGGAKYTHNFKGDGLWVYHLQIQNLTKKQSLSIERTAKNKRKRAKGTTPLEKRLDVLLPILINYPESKLFFL
jgi:predicted GIY-YIG superfamily endonuclease